MQEDLPCALYEVYQYQSFTTSSANIKHCSSSPVWDKYKYNNAIEIDIQLAYRLFKFDNTLHVSNGDKLIMYIEHGVTYDSSLCAQLKQKTKASPYYTMFLEYGIGSVFELQYLSMCMISGLTESMFKAVIKTADCK